jgi:hypothetical protein
MEFCGLTVCFCRVFGIMCGLIGCLVVVGAGRCLVGAGDVSLRMLAGVGEGPIRAGPVVMPMPGGTGDGPPRGAGAGPVPVGRVEGFVTPSLGGGGRPGGAAGRGGFGF